MKTTPRTKMNHLLLYGNYEQVFQTLSDEQVGRLVRAMLHYLNTGKEPRLKGIAGRLWPLLSDQIDRNIRKYEEVCERNRANAQKYWDRQREENATGTE